MFGHQDITDISSSLPCTHTNGTRPLDWIQKLIVHHSATAYDTGDIVQTLISEANYQIHNQAINPGGSPPDGLQYHWVIFKGVIYATRPLADLLWHASDWPTNQHSVAVCLQGNYDNITISDEDRKALDNLIWMLSTNATNDFTDLTNINTYDGQSLYSHHEVADANMGTQCCGSNLIPIVTAARNTKMQSEVDYWNSKNPPAPPTPTIDPLQGQVDSLNTKVTQLEGDNAALTTQVTSLTSQLGEANTNYQAAILHAKDLAGQINQLTADLNNEKAGGNTLVNELNTLSTQKAQLQKEYDALKSQVDGNTVYVHVPVGLWNQILISIATLFNTILHGKDRNSGSQTGQKTGSPS